MPNLILLSDLWGFDQVDWQELYLEYLSPHFNVTAYDICALANIDPSVGEQQIHQAFLKGGIDLAVNELLKKELPKSIVIGFSMGGYIGWKTIQAGFEAICFYGISATRLRFETKKIACPIHLIYGANDSYRPKAVWFEQMNCGFEELENKKHDLYLEESFIEEFCKRVVVSFA